MSSRCGLHLLLAAMSSCAHQVPISAPKPTVPYKHFDVVGEQTDANGFWLNPYFGAQAVAICAQENLPRAQWAEFARNKAPSSTSTSNCSWQFLELARPDDDRRPPCTTRSVDPDFADAWTTMIIDFTCRDSKLHYPGHINFENAYGTAVTIEGRLTWDSYSSPLGYFGDWDINFQFVPVNGAVLTAESNRHVHLEFDSREVYFKSGFWREILVAAVTSTTENVRSMLGDGANAVVTGLLGLDSEHGHVELHPIYALALKRPADLPNGTCAKGAERWAVFARSTGDEGDCSHWHRRHVMALEKDRLFSFRLPGYGSQAKNVQVCWAEPDTLAREVHKTNIDESDPEHPALVTIKIPDPPSLYYGEIAILVTDGSGNVLQSAPFGGSSAIPAPAGRERPPASESKDVAKAYEQEGLASTIERFTIDRAKIAESASRKVEKEKAAEPRISDRPSATHEQPTPPSRPLQVQHFDLCSPVEPWKLPEFRVPTTEALARERAAADLIPLVGLEVSLCSDPTVPLNDKQDLCRKFLNKGLLNFSRREAAARKNLDKKEHP